MNHTKWVTAWGSAVSITENKPEAYSKNITLRYPIWIPFAASAIKCTFDNFCGTESITIAKANLFINQTFYPLSFQGKESICIAAGESIECDECICEITNPTTAYISFYLEDYTQMRSGVYLSGPYSEGQYAIGNHMEDEVFDINLSRKTNIYYFLSNVSVLTDENCHSVVCFGDSITAQDWPDYLKKRITTTPTPSLGVVRRAASGSRLLRQYSCITYESYGLSGHNRYQHELPTEGADILILQMGINDIIHPVGEEINPFRPMSDLPTANEMIEEMKTYIHYAKELGYKKIYVGTLLPIEGWRTYAPFREKLRTEFNQWIRTTDIITKCIDFDEALRDPNQPTKMLKEYDSGDHLHPSKKGYEKMASILPVHEW